MFAALIFRMESPEDHKGVIDTDSAKLMQNTKPMLVFLPIYRALRSGLV
jgi:hypothetical protein